MGKLRTQLAGMCVAALLLGGVVTQPASAEPPRPSNVFAGVYAAHVDWQIFGRARFTLTLRTDHTGDDGFGHAITWHSRGDALEFNLTAGKRVATYYGDTSNKGINSKKHPGTMANNTGDSGIWWAVAQTPE